MLCRLATGLRTDRRWPRFWCRDRCSGHCSSHRIAVAAFEDVDAVAGHSIVAEFAIVTVAVRERGDAMAVALVVAPDRVTALAVGEGHHAVAGKLAGEEAACVTDDGVAVREPLQDALALGEAARAGP